MIRLSRTNSDNRDFIALVLLLDKYLAELDGAEHAFYNQLNKIDRIRHVVIAYEDEVPKSCGAIREFNKESTEVKRMYTDPQSRGRGLASAVLTELEKWAKELGYKRCILETGKRQPEAVSLYKTKGYRQIENYGKYAGIENSVCFEKII